MRMGDKLHIAEGAERIASALKNTSLAIVNRT